MDFLSKYDEKDLEEGFILNINKPLDWTSFDVVNKIRWTLKKQFGKKKIKVGHAGTLDPKATGVLLVCVGKKTKMIEQIQSLPKEYTGIIKLGATTPSFDLETEENEFFDYKNITQEQIDEVLPTFIGEIFQKPPIFSAVKKDGKRLYEFARKGEEVEIPKRQVTVHSFDAKIEELPFLNFKVSCSKGTYIRSLANDLGKALNSGGYLTELKRTKIGRFYIEETLKLPKKQSS